MVWFQGGVGEAIKSSKLNSKMMLIYVIGKEEPQKWMELWQNEQLQSICSKKFVSLKLEAESDSGKQFSSIYPVIFLPSIHLIGLDGKIKDCIGGDFTSIDDVINKIENVITSTQVVTSTTEENVKNEQVAGSSHVTSQPMTSQSMTSQPMTSQPMTSQSMTDEEKKEKVEEMRRKMEQRRYEKLIQEQEQEKQREIERRKLSKQMQSFKEKQQQQQMKEEIEKRKKEKAQDEKYKRELMKQIAQDREDRKKEFYRQKEERNQLKIEAAAAKKSPVVKPVEINEICLQYRFIDGSSLTRTYGLESTLGDAVDDLLNETKYSNVELSTRYPTRKFTTNEYNDKLLNLGLTHRSQLTVVPIKEEIKNSSKSSIFGIIFSLLWSILMIPITIMTSLYGMIKGQQNDSITTPLQQRENPQISDGKYPQSSSLRRRKRPLGGDVNIHRLNDVTDDVSDDDDDDATWNGNSTQQM